MNGHCINVDKNTKEANIQLYQIGGQIEYYTQFCNKHPELAKVNAELWKEMNITIIVNTVCTKYANIDSSKKIIPEF